jgi:O-antigen ligase
MPRTGHFFFRDVMFLVPFILSVLSWLVPLHFQPWVSWHSEVVAFSAVFLLSWAGVFRLIKKDQSRTISFPSLVLPFIALATIAVGQFITGLMTFGGDTLLIVLYLALCVMCITLGFLSAFSEAADVPASQAANASSALTLIANVVLLGAFSSAVVAFAQVFEFWEQSAWINRMLSLRRPGGNIGQPNQLATLLLMGIVSLLFLYESGKLRALPSVLIFLFVGTALAATESRTGVLSFLLLSGWWWVKNKRVNFRLSPWAVAVAGIGFLALFWAWPSIFAYVQQTSGGAAVVNTKAGARLVVWPQLLEAVFQRSWWGWGLGEVPKAHNAVVHAYEVSEPFSYSHNILLDLALGMGVPLTALLVLVTGGWLWRRVRTANQLLPWYCLALALPLAVHSMLEFPFTYAYFLVPVMFALGTLESLTGSKPALRIGLRPAAALLFVVSMMAAWSVVEYVAIEEDFRVARFEALRVGQTPASYERPHIFLLTQLDALLAGARIVPKPGMSPGEVELAKKVALRYPWTATQNRYALSLALNGNPEEATRQLLVMKAMHGAKTYNVIKENWRSLAQEKYPQLSALNLP